MDISVASNFERLLYNLYDDNSSILAKNMRSFPAKSIDIPQAKKELVASFFNSFRSDDEEIIQEIKETFTRHDYLLDPHTATGVRASNGIVNKEEPVITMGTAHPAKFTEAIEKALPSYTSELPNKVAKAFEQEEIFTILPDDYLEIKQFILSKAL